MCPAVGFVLARRLANVLKFQRLAAFWCWPERRRAHFILARPKCPFCVQFVKPQKLPLVGANAGRQAKWRRISPTVRQLQASRNPTATTFRGLSRPVARRATPLPPAEPLVAALIRMNQTWPRLAWPAACLFARSCHSIAPSAPAGSAGRLRAANRKSNPGARIHQGGASRELPTSGGFACVRPAGRLASQAGGRRALPPAAARWRPRAPGPGVARARCPLPALATLPPGSATPLWPAASRTCQDPSRRCGLATAGGMVLAGANSIVLGGAGARRGSGKLGENN